jgi:hypothetical protein
MLIKLRRPEVDDFEEIVNSLDKAQRPKQSSLQSARVPRPSLGGRQWDWPNCRVNVGLATGFDGGHTGSMKAYENDLTSLSIRA